MKHKAKTATACMH